MESRTLGHGGLVVSSYALGTMTFGQETPEADAFAILDRFVEAGGTLLDLADTYVAGASERIVGRWLATGGRRDEVILATKARFPVGDHADPNRQGLSRAWLHRAIDDSLRRLGVDHVELYQVHAWDPLVPVEEWLGALDDLVRLGKIRYVGVSNVRGFQLQRILDVAHAEGYGPVVSLQPQYNLLAREIEWELVPCCEHGGVGLLPWSPLGGGWLTGKYDRDTAPTGATRLGEDPERGVEAYAKRANDRTWAILDAVRETAAEMNATMSQVALAWVTAQPTVSSTILGVRTLGQLEDNLGAADLALGPDALATLSEVSAPLTPDYPYGLLARMEDERREQLG